MIMQLLRSYILGLNYEDLLIIHEFVREEKYRRQKIRILIHPRPNIDKAQSRIDNIREYRTASGLDLMECKHVIEYWWDKE